MRKLAIVLCAIAVAAAVALAHYGKSADATSPKPDYEVTATYIEACSCDMFCPCYFNEHPTGHGDKHFCEAALVMRVDKGHYKTTKLDGVKVWIATDLGPHFGSGKGDWLALTFDSAVTEEQKKAMLDIIPQLYPLEFKVLGVDAAPIEWRIDEARGEAVARIGDGSKAEVILERWKGPDPKKETVITNLAYWGADSNTGFRLWKNKRHYYNHFGKKFEYSGTNGFLITISHSGQAKAATAD
jgi:hypothetical protein